MPGTDYECMAAAYDEGRATSLQWLESWRRALTPFVPAAGVVLDLGAGTGIWAEALARWFDVRVVAVEPSAAMRSEAVRKRGHRLISYVGGRAEHIPLGDQSVECAWLSTVIHHFADVAGAVHELRRVLVPDGPVLVRNAFSGRTGGVPWLKYWPHARHAAERHWPTLEAVELAFGAAGFRRERLKPVTQVVDPSLAAFARRARFRADSTLAALNAEDFATGMRALAAAAAEERGPRPVEVTIDLLVMR